MLLFIDKKASRLVGMRYSEQGQTAEERFADYKKVAGIEVAHRRSTSSADVEVSTILSEVIIDAPIDAAVFVRPVEK